MLGFLISIVLMNHVETLVIGAGVIGSSVAMHLAQMGMDSVRVVDFDLEGSLSSSELNAGGVRATLSHPLNIEMSRLSIDYFAAHADEVGYRPCGYLWLYREQKFEQALRQRDVQTKMGWPVEAWDVSELKRRMPLIDKTDDLVGALYAPRDGLVNPNLMKNHYRHLARQAGVVFDDRTWIRSVEYTDQGVHLVAQRFAPQMTQEQKTDVLTGQYKSGETLLIQQVEYLAQRVVNCAGAWAGKVAECLHYQVPSYPVRRQISIFDCQTERPIDLTSYGMIIDPSGVYFHPEAMNMLAGFANSNEPRGFSYQYDGEAFFMESIWPALYERSSVFERLKHLTGWAGIYEVSPDECAIMGKVTEGEAGRSQRIFEAHSFSGHGVMHSYCAGKVLAELIVGGKYETVDAAILAGGRFAVGQLLSEGWVI